MATRGSDRQVTVIAACGHESSARVHGYRGGTKSSQNIARARAEDCFACRDRRGEFENFDDVARRYRGRKNLV